MAARFTSTDTPKSRETFPYRVELRPNRAPERLREMKRWLQSAAAEGNYTLWRITGSHVERGEYEATVVAFDHPSTSYRFGDTYAQDRW